jgi:hypothetical protein
MLAVSRRSGVEGIDVARHCCWCPSISHGRKLRPDHRPREPSDRCLKRSRGAGTPQVGVSRGEVLERVQLIQVVGDDPAVGDEDDPVLWEIVANKGAQTTPARIVVGDTPPGFDVAKPLTSPIRPGRPYAILIDSNLSRGLAALEFDLGSLKADRVLSTGGYYTEREFREQGTEKCVTPPAPNS